MIDPIMRPASAEPRERRSGEGAADELARLVPVHPAFRGLATAEAVIEVGGVPRRQLAARLGRIGTPRKQADVTAQGDEAAAAVAGRGSWVLVPTS